MPGGVTVYANGRSPWQTSHAAALVEGLAAHGIGATVVHSSFVRAPTKTVACWGWRIGRRLREFGHNVLVMERGYVGDRFSWTSLGWNGLNGRATFYPKDDPTRFATHFGSLLRPWKADGEYVLLVGQVPGDASLGGLDLSAWYEQTARSARVAYGKPVVFRPHPVALQRGSRHAVRSARTLTGTLDEALAGAAICVTFNSNTAVDAVLAGVPTVAADVGTMAGPVTARKIGERVTPDREAWAARLAWCQWTMDEIRKGIAWDAVKPQQQC